MSPRVQAKMLRVLEEQRLEPVGSNTAISVDVRVISATNKPLDGLIENGHFRPDLSLSSKRDPVPGAAGRTSEDIPVLTEFFNKKFSLEYGKTPKQFETDAIDSLQNYEWPETFASCETRSSAS